jgi:hypothetical protein
MHLFNDLKTDYQAILNWFDADVATAAALLRPVIDEIVKVLRQDAKIDLAAATTAAATALAGGAAPVAIAAAVLPVLEANFRQQSVTIGVNALNALASSVAQGAVAQVSAHA